MDKMSWVAILSVSVPEELFATVVVLLLTGCKSMLPYSGKKENDFTKLVQLLLATVLLVIGFDICRAVATNLVTIVGINAVWIVVVYWSVYTRKCNPMSFVASVRQSLVFLLVLISFEMIIFPPIMRLLDLQTLGDIYKSDWVRFVISIPQKVYLIALIVMFWRFNRVLFNIKRSWAVLATYIFLLFNNLLMQLLLARFAINNISKATKLETIVYILVSVMMAVANYIVINLPIIIKDNIKSKNKEE